jgi:chromosome segregation ATPase
VASAPGPVGGHTCRDSLGRISGRLLWSGASRWRASPGTGASAAANRAVDDKKAEINALLDQLPALQAAVDNATTAVTSKQGEITHAERPDGHPGRSAGRPQRPDQAAEAAVLDLQTRVAPLLAQLSQLKNDVSATEAKLGRLQAELMSLDKQVTDAQAVLRNVQPQKKTNKDAIAGQTATVQDLQDTLGTVQSQIKAIDASITLGGCVA